MLNLLMRIAFLLVILAPRTAISQCVRRQQMLSRGQRWVDDGVAYSQTTEQTVQVLCPCAGAFQNQDHQPVVSMEDTQ